MINPVNDSILFGFNNYKEHTSWSSERYAYDILKKSYSVKSDKLKDYSIYLSDVYAPIDGEVIGIKDDEDDIKPNVEKFKSLIGNYMYLKVDKEYLILAHLENNSIKVKIGDLLAKVGNYGITSKPHLHMGLQKENPLELKNPLFATSLPIKIK